MFFLCPGYKIYIILHYRLSSTLSLTVQLKSYINENKILFSFSFFYINNNRKDIEVYMIPHKLMA
jgi:hypothetical protein